jgi:Peptidase family M1 domain
MTPGHRRRTISALTLAAAVAGGTAIDALAAPSAPEHCSPGAMTLASPGSRMYPDTGNGGYTSVHTSVDLVYDSATNRFLPGNHVELTDRATQCLSSLSLDFERESANGDAGPDLTVGSITVDGRPATFAFVQPTYPGDPNGPGDPDPRAHEASQDNPVGGPEQNPLPPACSPELPDEEVDPDELDGTQCPANKLVITPSAPVRSGATFTIDVQYTGRPGVHNDGDGSTEGWFRTADGSFVSTEPVGTEDWMPLNDFPSAKPTYEFHETVPAGIVAIANGMLLGTVAHAPGGGFAGGSVTWNWQDTSPINSYLVQSSIGHYSLFARTTPAGETFYEAQDEAIPASQQAANRRLIEQQPEITEYESNWAGPFPFATDGVIVGDSHEVGFEEEMESMIAFTDGEVELPVLWHENFHQWWGDNVTQSSYENTFFKEGLAEWMESYVFPARRLKPGAAQRRMKEQFASTYRSRGSFWTIAPSHPFPYSLFDGSSTYERPAAAYEALHQILGEPVFAQTLRQIQQEHGGATITEPELERAFAEHLPSRSPACLTRLSAFFGEWFDTAYPRGGGRRGRPRITGPGLAGEDFYSGGCASPPGAAALTPSGAAPSGAEEAELAPARPDRRRGH